MSETTCFFWRTSWLCARFLAVISVILFQISTKIWDPCRREDRAKLYWRFCSDETKVNELHTGQFQINHFGVWSDHDLSRWGAGSDSKKVLSKSESPDRVMRMSTWVSQSLRQGIATESDTTDNVRHYQVEIQENVKSTETWQRDRVISSNDSFRQRTAKSVSTTDVKTEFLNMEIAHY